MAVKMSQGLKQTQNLAMTPQLQQAIKLLTLTHLEMTNVIAEEMVENPMLEEVEGVGDVEVVNEETREATSDDFSEAPLMKEKDDFDWDSYADSFNSNSSAPNMASPSSDSDEMPGYENIVSKSMTLAEHLEWQLKMENLSDQEWKLAHLIIGNINAITYKEVFPLIKENTIWLGNGMGRWISGFIVPKSYELYGTETRIDESGNRIIATNSCLWLTNIDHGRRHQHIPLMTMADNLKYSKHKEIKGKKSYDHYDNYDAIEVPFTDSIPSDYDGAMGVPVSFLDKYSPEQFEIVGRCENEDLYHLKTKVYTSAECKQAYFDKFGEKGTYDMNSNGVLLIDGLLEKVYQRVLIKHRKVTE